MSSPKVYDRLGKVPMNTVLSAADSINVFGVTVGTRGLRLRTFKQKGTICSCCGLQATHFAVERHKGMTHKYHFNLWATVGATEVLFTHDHTLARSLGGSDTIDNTTTMCDPCNSDKSKVERLLIAKARGEVPQSAPTRVLTAQQKKVQRAEKAIARCLVDPTYAARRAAYHQHHGRYDPIVVPE